MLPELGRRLAPRDVVEARLVLVPALEAVGGADDRVQPLGGRAEFRAGAPAVADDRQVARVALLRVDRVREPHVDLAAPRLRVRDDEAPVRGPAPMHDDAAHDVLGRRLRHEPVDRVG